MPLFWDFIVAQPIAIFSLREFFLIQNICHPPWIQIIYSILIINIIFNSLFVFGLIGPIFYLDIKLFFNGTFSTFTIVSKISCYPAN
jgi:hypothetical protein